MQTNRTPLLPTHLAIDMAAIDVNRPWEDGYGLLQESRIRVDADARQQGLCSRFWSDYPKVAAGAVAGVAFGLVAGASGATFAATHDWAAAASVFGLGNVLIGCVGGCLLNLAERPIR